MSDGFWNEVRRHGRNADTRASTRHGTISSYDPSNYAVKVALQPDGTLTGWIPLKAICAGNGWGIFCPPAIGTAVEVQFQEADGGVGSAGLSFFNDVERPLSVPAGEIWLVNEAGLSVKLTAQAITLDTGQGATVRLQSGQIISQGAWSHQGALTVTGGDVEADGISLKTHKHGKVQAGTAITDVPQ